MISYWHSQDLGQHLIQDPYSFHYTFLEENMYECMCEYLCMSEYVNMYACKHVCTY